MKKKILMLGTGGTIASKKTEYGLTPGITSEELLSYVPQVQAVCDVDTIQVCNIDSTNVEVKHWQMLVKSIEVHYEEYDGFVICHGTDTMAYTAAALSYMIQNSRKPIVITGSQKPINLEITDARINLWNSFVYAADEDSQGVYLVFDGKVIIGTRAKKVQSKSYNAFDSINFPYPATIQDGKVLRYIPTIPYTKPVQFYHKMGGNVMILKMIPEMRVDLLAFVFEKYDCIIIESFGVGGIPSCIVDAFYQQMDAIQEQDNKLVIMTTQVANEGSNMTVYEVGRKVKQDFNMLEAYDMTLEAVITKAMWLMALTEDNKEINIKKMFHESIHFDTLH